MLKTTIELYPFGKHENRRTLSTISVCNDLSNLQRPEYGNYVCFYKDVDQDKEIGIGIEIEIKNHKREDGFLKLVYKTIEKFLKEENRVKESNNKEFS